MLVEKEETGSTNDDVRALAREGAPHGAAVFARRQRAGRGRLGRAFASPEGGAYVSVLLRPRAPPARWGLLPLAAGLAVAEALETLGFDARIKWPNDVRIARRKVAGVLVESHFDANPFAVVGIGVNVAATPPDLPDATCLAEHGAPPDPRALAQTIVARLVQEAARVEDDPANVAARVRGRCDMIGARVAWEDGTGTAADIAEDGALIVEHDGIRTRLMAGEVRILQS